MRQRSQIAKAPRSRDDTAVPPTTPPGIGPSPWEIASDDDSGTLHLEPNSAYHRRQLQPSSVGGVGPGYGSGGSDDGLPTAPGSYPYSWRQYNQFRQYGSDLDDSQHSVGDIKKHDDRLHHYHHRSRLLPVAPHSLTDHLRPVYGGSIRTPKMIPDSKYQAYLTGKSMKRKVSPIDAICCSKFCAGFSIVAMTFLIFIGILLDTQPIFIKGVLPQHVQYTNSKKMEVFYSTTLSERLTPASHAYQAAVVYFLTACLCLGYAYNARWWFQTRVIRSRYSDIPDADSTIPTFHQPDDEDGHILGHHRPSTGPGAMTFGGRATQAYNYYNTNFSAKMIQLVSLAWNRVGIFVETFWPWPKNRHARRRRTASTKDV